MRSKCLNLLATAIAWPVISLVECSGQDLAVAPNLIAAFAEAVENAESLDSQAMTQRAYLRILSHYLNSEFCEAQHIAHTAPGVPGDGGNFLVAVFELALFRKEEDRLDWIRSLSYQSRRYTVLRASRHLAGTREYRKAYRGAQLLRRQDMQSLFRIVAEAAVGWGDDELLRGELVGEKFQADAVAVLEQTVAEKAGKSWTHPLSDVNRGWRCVIRDGVLELPIPPSLQRQHDVPKIENTDAVYTAANVSEFVLRGINAAQNQDAAEIAQVVDLLCHVRRENSRLWCSVVPVVVYLMHCADDTKGITQFANKSFPFDAKCRHDAALSMSLLMDSGRVVDAIKMINDSNVSASALAAFNIFATHVISTRDIEKFGQLINCPIVRSEYYCSMIEEFVLRSKDSDDD